MAKKTAMELALDEMGKLDADDQAAGGESEDGGQAGGDYAAERQAATRPASVSTEGTPTTPKGIEAQLAADAGIGAPNIRVERRDDRKRDRTPLASRQHRSNFADELTRAAAGAQVPRGERTVLGRPATLEGRLAQRLPDECRPRLQAILDAHTSAAAIADKLGELLGRHFRDGGTSGTLESNRAALRARIENMTAADSRDHVPADHPELVRARHRLAELDQIYARQSERYRVASRLSASLNGLISRVSDYLDDIGRAAVLEPIFGGPAAPRPGETPEAAVERLRAEIVTLAADRRDAERAPRPVAEALPVLEAEVRKLAERGAPDVGRLLDGLDTVRWPNTNVQTVGYGHKGEPVAIRAAVPDALAFHAWLHQDALLARLRADLEEMADDASALSVADRAARLAEIDAAMLAAEVAEVDIIAAAGWTIPARQNTDPRAAFRFAGPAPKS